VWINFTADLHQWLCKLKINSTISKHGKTLLKHQGCSHLETTRESLQVRWCLSHTHTHTQVQYVFLTVCCSRSGLWFADGLPCHNDMRFVRRRCIQVSLSLTHRCVCTHTHTHTHTWSCKRRLSDCVPHLSLLLPITHQCFRGGYRCSGIKACLRGLSDKLIPGSSPESFSVSKYCVKLCWEMCQSAIQFHASYPFSYWTEPRSFALATKVGYLHTLSWLAAALAGWPMARHLPGGRLW